MFDSERSDGPLCAPLRRAAQKNKPGGVEPVGATPPGPLSQKQADERFLPGGVGGIPEGRVEPGALDHHALAVGEGVEAGPAVIAAHAAVPHSAEGQAAGGQVDHGVVDTAAPEGDPLQKEPPGGPVLGEEVEGQGVGPAVDEVGGLLKAVEGQNGEEGAEDLLLHHRVVGRDPVQNGGLDLQALRVARSAADHLVRVDEVHHPVEVPPVDHAHIAPVVQGVGPVQGGHPAPDAGDQLVLDPPVRQHIVGGHAGLAAVEELAEDQPLGGQVQPGGGVHHAGALAPQLQGHRGQMGGGGRHDLPADLGAPGEEDIVEFLGQQRPAHLRAALRHADQLRREAAGQQLPQHRRRGGGVLRGLQDAAVARRQRPDEGLQREEKGVVPGGEDQHHAPGLGQREAFPGKLGQGREAALGPHPPGQMAANVAQLGQRHAHLAQIALGGGLVQVGRQSGVDPVFP